MKILHLIDTLRSGGKERQLVEVLKYFSQQKNCFSGLVVMSNDIHYDYIEKINVKTYKILRKRKNDVSVFLKFYKLFRDWKPDIVHSWSSMCSVYAVPAVVALKIKFVNHFLRSAPPNLKFSDKEIESIRSAIPELPEQRRERFSHYGLNPSQIEIFVVSKRLGDYYEKVASELDSTATDYHKRKNIKDIAKDEPQVAGKLHSLAANYIITEFPPLLNLQKEKLDNISDSKISPEAFAELIVLVFHGELSSTAAKAVLKEMMETGTHPEQIIREKNLTQVSDKGELQRAVGEVISENPKPAEDYKKGKKESLQFLVGQVMKKTKGRANPEVARQLLEKELTK